MNKKNRNNYDEGSIDFFQIISTLWKGRRFIFKYTLIVSLSGIILSLFIQNIYTASSIFYPHYEQNISQNSNLQNIAGLAGIDIGSETSNNIPSNLYPNLINSPEFKIEILDSKIYLNEIETTYRKYLLDNQDYINFKKILLYPISLLARIIPKNNIKNKNIDILKLSDEEYDLHESLSEKIILELNEKEGFIQLSVKDNNPVIASQVAKIANEILQKIIDFKLKNINDIYEFVSSQLEIAKYNFYVLQDSLAIFNDKNRNIKSDLFLNQYYRIESEYLISKNIYNELALNKERTAIDVKKNTPIFTIIKPVIIPNEKSEPKRSIIALIFAFMGITLSSSYLMFKDKFIEIWNSLKL